MSDYRRNYVPGGTYALTLVTYGRRQILTSPEGRQFLRKSIDHVQSRRPFTVVATVLLPDHWHLILSLPRGGSDFSTRIRLIKDGFTRQWRNADLEEANTSQSQLIRGERGVWQPRFWEHTIRGEDDL